MTDPFSPQWTCDGSATFFSAEFDELFHSEFGAAQEAEGKFVVPCELRRLAPTQDRIRLLDICYGLGYNSAAALAAIWAVNPACVVELVALDVEARPAQAAIAHHALAHYPAAIVAHLATLSTAHRVTTPQFTAQFHLGDARQTVQTVVRSHYQADAIFLDPFSPPKCPQLWTVEFLTQVAQCLAPTGILATYSCAAAVRAALQQAGLQIASSASVGRKAPGTIARWDGTNLPPLTPREQEHLATRAAVPYRDRTGTTPAATILAHRQQEQAHSPLEPSSQWKRRWFAPPASTGLTQISG
ncbi:MnmC family methyltransferase [Spirulina major CS-329]|uniref:tRNA (5-methylaminomethyl-2-thiouridine)(34)-methyltransferase MnmD n=1 Tax=Spirulina TaxID=1154 RepID=UPI00232D0B10|nr:MULTISPECIES: MnmC family methyltransferase [Spirulina]MDB9495037.1 MnmC family methyltransferase [Spirulina subsalsa CS-330]MDB9504214.1 MnmC family methyltransferase [Spirulina major CS-329]